MDEPKKLSAGMKHYYKNRDAKIQYAREHRVKKKQERELAKAKQLFEKYKDLLIR